MVSFDAVERVAIVPGYFAKANAATNDGLISGYAALRSSQNLNVPVSVFESTQSSLTSNSSPVKFIRHQLPSGSLGRDFPPAQLALSTVVQETELRLQAKLEQIDQRLDQLTQLLASRSTPSRPDGAPERRSESATAPASPSVDRLADYLNAIADGEIENSDGMTAIASAELEALDPDLRAAAARALAVVAPDVARVSLDAKLSTEKNPIVMAVMRGVIKSLS